MSGVRVLSPANRGSTGLLVFATGGVIFDIQVTK
jgi:hypothetical protein